MKKTRNVLPLIDQNIWEALKELTNTGKSPEKLREVTGRGTTTIRNVRLSTSFEDYKRIAREQVEHYAKLKTKPTNVLEAELPRFSFHQQPKPEKKKVNPVKKQLEEKQPEFIYVERKSIDKILELLELILVQTQSEKPRVRKLFGFI